MRFSQIVEGSVHCTTTAKVANQNLPSLGREGVQGSKDLSLQLAGAASSSVGQPEFLLEKPPDQAKWPVEAQ